MLWCKLQVRNLSNDMHGCFAITVPHLLKMLRCAWCVVHTTQSFATHPLIRVYGQSHGWWRQRAMDTLAVLWASLAGGDGRMEPTRFFSCFGEEIHLLFVWVRLVDEPSLARTCTHWFIHALLSPSFGNNCYHDENLSIPSIWCLMSCAITELALLCLGLWLWLNVVFRKIVWLYD